MFALGIPAVQQFWFFFLKKRGQYILLSTQVKKIIVHELTLQISLVLMRCVCTHIKVKHSLFNIEEEIRCSKLLRSRATKGKILFLLMCRDHHLSYLAMAIFWRHFFSLRSATTPTKGIKEKHKAILKALKIIQ